MNRRAGGDETMQWYFVENGEKVGPHEENAFEELVRSGRVSPQTLVWHAGMENWQPLEQLRAPAPVSDAEGAVPAAPAPLRPARCGVCGTEHGPEDLMRFRDTLVCPSCKPAFVQRMREGAGQPGQLRYAGFWIRFAAKFIDGLILTVFSLLITVLSGVTMAGLIAGGGEEPALGMLMAVQGVTMLLQMGVQAAFITFFLSRYAATPGKMATGLVVVRSDGSALTTGRAFGRCFGEWLSGLTIGIGYLMAAFDEEKRALHDRVCDTRVAYKASARP